MENSTINFNSLGEYCLDVWQRSVLFLDILRERGDNTLRHNAAAAPNVLGFSAELIRDGRQLERPVNYLLVRIQPPAGTEIDAAKPPIVVVDPRAGHGPGIGGMKADSEIGEGLKAGHACYFIGFLPNPEPGQTIEDVWNAEAIFIADVAARHPEAQGKPIVIANCQAGWQTMIMAALNPDLTGPILLAGAPLAYWAGVHGKNPMRYSGGLLGGTWLTALTGDLGNGIFDGANLIANFESLNPANTYWEKPYNVFSKVDTEAKRFLDFETWWGSPVLMNAGEMQWIADNLFVGNKLSIGQIRTSDGARVDLRNVKSPIIVFCSWGDDITPPQQALGWLLDLYDNVGEIIAAGQTIVYTMHQSIGHLGIFVSGKVATKEHSEFVSSMELIDAMPPGLYEAVIGDIDDNTVNRNLVEGKYLFRLEMRTLDDLRALGGNDADDDARFATVARISDSNLGLYRTLAQPAVRAIANEPMAEALRALHPNRMRFSSFSSENPLMQPIKSLAEKVRENRRPASPDNPWLAMGRAASSGVTSWLQRYGEARDAWSEAVFLATYGTPWLQAMVGLASQDKGTPRRIVRDLAREAAAVEAQSQLSDRFDRGGVAEAVLRALIYIRLPDGSADERGFRMLKIIGEARAANGGISPQRIKTMAKEQMQIVMRDADRAIEALPKLVDPQTPEAAKALDAIHQLLAARGPLEGEGKARLAHVEVLLGGEAAADRNRKIRKA